MRYRRVFVPGASYFFTLVTYRRAPIFSDPAVVDLYRRAVRKVQEARPFTIEAEVILPEHIHLLCTLPDGDADYPTRLRLIKTAFTRAMFSRSSATEPSPSRMAKGERAIWQRRYWEHTIRDERDFRAHLDYIHINPVKHGLAKAARDWQHSTFLKWVERGAYDPWWGGDEMPPLPDWVEENEYVGLRAEDMSNSAMAVVAALTQPTSRERP
jgi:putative transposase